MKNPGLEVRARTNGTYLADRKIALYRLSQILNYKTDGSLVNFMRKHFQSTQKTTEDVDNGHLKECRLFDVDLHGNTFKIWFCHFSTVEGPYGGTGAITPEPAAAIDFFFLVREKGGFVRTLRTPLGYVPEKSKLKERRKKKY